MAYRSKAQQRRYASRHYRENSAQYKLRAKAHDRRKAKVLRRYIADYLSSHPCIGCGEADPIVLEFDHRNAAEKKFNIANAPKLGVAIDKVIAEIAKCDIRCANCHRRRTFQQRRDGEFSISDIPDDQLRLFLD